MRVKDRIKRLEETTKMTTEPVRIAHFIVVPGHLEPEGYTCQGITIMRNPGESIEDLQARCIDAVDLPEHTRMLIFDPIH